MKGEFEMAFTFFGKTYGNTIQDEDHGDNDLIKPGMREELIPYSGSTGELEAIGIYRGERCEDDPRYRRALFPPDVKLVESSFGRKVLASHIGDRSVNSGRTKDIIDRHGNVIATCFHCNTHGRDSAWIEIHYNKEHDLRKSHPEIWNR